MFRLARKGMIYSKQIHRKIMEPTTPQAQIPNTQESGVESVEIIINHVQNILEVNEAGVIETLKGIFTRVPQEGELFGVIELFRLKILGLTIISFQKKMTVIKLDLVQNLL